MRATKPLPVILAKSIRLSTILILMIVSGLASALMASRPSRADDDYLRSIRSEGHKLEQLDRHPVTNDEKNSDAHLLEFEAALIQDSPDSYRIYQQLAPEKRQAVYKYYLDERNLKAVRRRIIELRLGS